MLLLFLYVLWSVVVYVLIVVCFSLFWFVVVFFVFLCCVVLDCNFIFVVVC